MACTLHGNRYLNITSRCTLRCAFCPKASHDWVLEGRNLHLDREPTVREMIEAVPDPTAVRWVVFSGLGEPTLRLYAALEAASDIRHRGGRIRIDTDGLAGLVFGRDVAPDLEGIVHALHVLLIAQDEDTYNRHCQPTLSGSYPALLDFVDRVREFVPIVTLVVIEGLPGVDIPACRRLAAALDLNLLVHKPGGHPVFLP